MSDFNLIANVDAAVRYTDYVHDIFSTYMFKGPLRGDYLYAFNLLALYGESTARDKLMDYVLQQNEHKYLKECLDAFLSWEPVPLPVRSINILKVRYYGPIGTTGYATVCRDIVSSIVGVNQYLDLSFVPLSVQNFNCGDCNDSNRLLRSVCRFTSADEVYRDYDPVDVVILHSVCDLWIPIVRREKRRNPKVVTIGITVWETDATPPQWTPHLRCVDRVTVPCRFNMDVFARCVPGLDVTFLPHPVLKNDVNIPETVPASLSFPTGPYVFYTINEWSGRKGLELLVRSFVEEFSSDDNVLLFIKTHGSVSKDIGSQFIESTLATRSNPPKIIVDYDRWSDGEIEYLHNVGNCYVSLTRSEGHGLGACHAALRGKYVIMSNYGGQVDYLKGVAWVKCTSTAAYLCTPFDDRHERCLDLPCCRFFSYFIAAQQCWGDPDVVEAKSLMRTAYTDRLCGNPYTTRYLLTHFDSDTIGKQFADYVLSTVFLREGRRVPWPRAGLPDRKSVV